MYLGPAVLYGINLVSLFVLVIYSMLSVSVELTLYSLAPLPILSLSIYYVSNLINKRSTVIQQQLARFEFGFAGGVLESGLSSLTFRRRFMGKYFAEESEVYKEKALDLARVNALFFPTHVL
jgi:ATP-binding cassette subfamily B multidrug efflux pump